MNRSRVIQGMSVAAATAAALLTTAVYADPIDHLVTRNGTQQAQIESDLSKSHMDPLRAAQVEQRAADVYRQQAQMIPAASDTQKAEMRQAQRDLAGAIAWAEKHPAHARASDMDRMHMEVASMRNAEQQHLIARELENGKLTPEQAATLEDAQAKIAAAESDAVTGGGHEGIETVRSIQHAQNLQDYAIKVNPSV
jgi:hypothetical protein